MLDAETPVRIELPRNIFHECVSDIAADCLPINGRIEHNYLLKNIFHLIAMKTRFGIIIKIWQYFGHDFLGQKEHRQIPSAQPIAFMPLALNMNREQIKSRIILRLAILPFDMDLIILHRSEPTKSSGSYFARPVTVEGKKDRARVAEMAEEFSRVNVVLCTYFKHS